MVAFLLVCAVALIPWTVGLAVTLPARYVVRTWTLTWTGFDLALLACFAVTAWALWNQRRIALPAAIFTSALLLCDAWFDLLTTDGGADLLVSAATALLGEIPGAIVLATISSELLRANALFSAQGPTQTTHRSLWRAPLDGALDQSYRPALGASLDDLNRSCPEARAPRPAAFPFPPRRRPPCEPVHTASQPLGATDAAQFRQ